MTARTTGPTIVVGCDGSEASRAAILVAARRARPDGKVVLVHAYEVAPELLGSGIAERMLIEHRERGRAILDAIPLTGNDELLELDYETVLVGAPPARALADVAREVGAAEIVVGARGLGRLRALIGSVSHELMDLADRPVVVIPAAAVYSVLHDVVAAA